MGLVERALLKQIRRRVESQLPQHRLEVVPNEYRQSGDMLRIHLRARAVLDLHESSGQWWMSLTEVVDADLPSVEGREHSPLGLSDMALVPTVARRFAEHVQELEQLAANMAQASTLAEIPPNAAEGPDEIGKNAEDEKRDRDAAAERDRELRGALHLQAKQAAEAEMQAGLTEEEWVRQTKEQKATGEIRDMAALVEARLAVTMIPLTRP